MRSRDAPAGAPIRVGVSSCILGNQVRYDGGHKLDRVVRDTLGALVELVAVCPEVELGLGVPRETVRMVAPPTRGGQPRMVAPASGLDHTDAMLRWARARCRELAALELCGFIVQPGSPSCGLARVRVDRAFAAGRLRASRRPE